LIFLSYGETGLAGSRQARTLLEENKSMLILSRKVGEAIIIADNIKIRVLENKGGLVKLGVEAPDQVVIHREEIYLRILEENKKAAMDSPDDLSMLSDVFPLQKIE